MLRFQDDNDMAAFETLFERHKDGLMGFLWGLSGDRAIAEDISQHCWMKLLELSEAQRYRPMPDASFRAYLYTLGRNRYIDEYKRKHEATRTGPLEDPDAVAAPSSSTTGEVARVQRQAQIGAAMKQLPNEQREVIALWMVGATIEQMSEIAKAPRETVLSRKKYGLKKLRAAFAKLGVDAYDP